MNWLRLLEIIETARRRIQRDDKGKPDPLGYGWVCYCPVCCELRALTA